VNAATDRADHIRSVLDSVVGVSRAIAAPRSTPFGEAVLTRTQLDILFRLAHANSPVTPGGLAEALQVTPGAITQSLEQLRRAGFVQQQVAPHDGRTRVLHLSDDARMQVEAFETATVGRAAPWFTGLTDGQLTELAALLARVETLP
jgi:DNA-binding MarR family transcriptional regulator